MGVSDPYDSSNQQACTYAYDDLARLDNDNCGSTWSQSFSDDAFGNLSKSGSISFAPTYNLLNQVSVVGGYNPTYDADGNMTSDTVNTYNWDSDGNMIKAVTLTATTNVTYDAMDRAVEFEVGSAYTQTVYGPGGGKLALMSGQSLTKAFVPLAGGAVAVYNSSGLEYYRHGDWLGSSRLASTPSRGVYYDGAYAPYGENYAESGTKDRSFTGQDQDMVSSGSYPLYDFLMREYHPTWGRWISPDPAGLAAVDPTNPQTWNRYAYVGGNPLSFVDPLGLSGTEVGTCISGGDYCGFTITTTTIASACGEYYCANAYALMEQIMSSSNDCATTHNCQQPGQNPGNSGGAGGGAGPGNPQNLGKDENCNTPPAPSGASVKTNISLVQNALKTTLSWSTPSTKLAFFDDMVKTGGPWDYKQGGSQYVDFGNFNYGATCGAMGYSLYFCQNAAGLNHNYRAWQMGLPLGSGVPFLIPPYGDQNADQNEIKKGYDYYSKGC